MPELTFTAPPPRADLLRQLRLRLTDSLPGLRVVAQDLLGADSRIDFVGVEPSGRTVLVLVGAAGGDLELLTRGLAQRAWAEARLGDWLQLAPELGLRPEAGIRLLLLCPAFRPECQAAAAALGEHAPALRVYHCLRNGAGVAVLVEPDPGSAAPAPPAQPETAAASAFRTGLTDADLGLTPEEHREFRS